MSSPKIPKAPKITRSPRPAKKPTKVNLAIARIIFAPLGLFLGAGLINILADNMDWSVLTDYKIYFQIATAVLFGTVFFFSAPAFLRALLRFSSLIENGLSAYTGKEILMGIVGLLGGIVVAIAAGVLLGYIVTNELAVYILTAILIVVLGFIGMRVGSKMLSDVWIPATNIEKSNPVRSENDIKILDSSSLIDGRVLDIVRTGFLSGSVIIPDFILTELSKIADNDDPLKKNRGRRGLDIAAQLQREKGIRVEIDYSVKEDGDTDYKLLLLAEQKKAKLVTVDYNLNKLSTAKNVEVLNVNELSNAIKPIALPGEKMRLKIVKEGKEYGQGVAYSPDGTMIVIENGGSHIGQEVEVTITTSLQTSAGRIIFSRIM